MQPESRQLSPVAPNSHNESTSRRDDVMATRAKFAKRSREVIFDTSTWSGDLLGSNPRELSESFSRFRTENPDKSVLEFLLSQLEGEAQQLLKADLPSGISENLELSDLCLASNQRRSF